MPTLPLLFNATEEGLANGISQENKEPIQLFLDDDIFPENKREKNKKGLKLEISIGLLRVFVGYLRDTWKCSSYPFVVRACLSAMVMH